MADDISRQVMSEVEKVIKNMVSKFSAEQRKRYESDFSFQSKIAIQAYKKVLDEMHSSLRDLSIKYRREEAEKLVEESNLKIKIISDSIDGINKEIASLKERDDLSEKQYRKERTNLEERGRESSKQLRDEINARKQHEKAVEIYQKNEEKHLTYKERQQRKVEKLENDLNEKRLKAVEMEIALANAPEEEKEDAQKALDEAKKEERKATNALAAEELKNSLKDSLVGAINKLANAVDSNLETLGGYQAGMMARLQGSSSDFDDMVSLVRRNLASSPLVKQKDVLDNLQKLTEKGIAYDLEQRAFLATVSDKIATTFDATNGTLLRLIRVQQADTTAARLGMEANLTRMLNAMFSDTSYLSDVYDTVSDAILDANSQLSRDNSVAFEYTVQKWLGALYSLGLSQGAVSSIAQGINLLGTGNVSALAGNEQLQTLLAMSASKGGLAYADLLIDGLDSSETNKLLRGMSEYLKEIAEGADNQVVKNAFAQVFGLSVSDFAALQNLTSGEIENIYNQNMGYSGAMGELTYQLSQIGSRIPLGQRIKNVFDNIMFATASEIFESPASYVTYLITDAIEQVTGGIPLPAVYAFGTGLDLTAFTVEGIIKDAIVGINLLKNIPAIFGSMLSGGGVSLSNWGGEPGYLTRGNEFINISFGAQRSTSSGTYVGSASSTDMKSSSISSAAEEGKEFKSASGQEDVEYAKAVPALEKGGAEMWLKWLKAMTAELDENPLPVKIAGQSSPVSVQMVFGTSDGLAPNVYTMENLIKAVVDAYNDGSQAFKVESTNSFIDAVNNAYSGGV